MPTIGSAVRACKYLKLNAVRLAVVYIDLLIAVKLKASSRAWLLLYLDFLPGR